jgi:hypothetical protein
LFAKAFESRFIAILVKPYMTLKAVREGIILLMMRTQATPACCFQYSFRVFPCLFAFFLLHVLLELFLVADAPPLFRVEAPIELVAIKISEVV